MKVLALTALSTAMLATVPAAAPAQATRGTYAFTGVNVVPMDRERVLENQTVVVRDGRIVELGPSGTVAVPSGVTRVEARGKYLMPGLAEMHAHIPPPQNGSMAYAHEVLFLYVARGVTTIRGMLGHPAHLALRGQVAAGEVLGPRIWTSGPSVNGRSVPTVQAADSAVRATKAEGYDFIKIHPGLRRVVFDTLDAVADRLGVKYAGHVPEDVGVPRALEAEYWSIDHLDGYVHALVPADAEHPSPSGPFSAFGAHLANVANESRIPLLARATRDAGVWNVPTQSLFESYASGEPADTWSDREELRYLPRQTVRGWINFRQLVLDSAPPLEARQRFLALRRSLLKALHNEGAVLLLGSDAPQVWNVPGFSIRRELESLVAAGLTPYDALVTGTRNVARYFGIEDEAGTVAVGKRADLILLDANPLANVGNVGAVAGVMVNGRWLPKEEIDRRLADIAAKYR